MDEQQTHLYRTDALVQQLEGAHSGLELAAALIPEAWHHRPPAGALVGLDDAWSAAMQLAHLARYEEQLAVPVLMDLATGSDGTAALRAMPAGPPDWFQRSMEQLAAEPMRVILTRLDAALGNHLAALRALGDARLNTPLTPVWSLLAGDAVHQLHPPGWVVAKSVQHAWEHGTAVYRLALRLTWFT